MSRQLALLSDGPEPFTAPAGAQGLPDNARSHANVAMPDFIALARFRPVPVEPVPLEEEFNIIRSYIGMSFWAAMVEDLRAVFGKPAKRQA